LQQSLEHEVFLLLREQVRVHTRRVRRRTVDEKAGVSAAAPDPSIVSAMQTNLGRDNDMSGRRRSGGERGRWSA
jgi:hypothetical protein